MKSRGLPPRVDADGRAEDAAYDDADGEQVTCGLSDSMARLPVKVKVSHAANFLC
jgi:hypothetical protein